uniref:Phosphoribosyltransferase domain-containing protein n=1 Tax=Noctiluca scintillans TaxID=2966 RepID=A0A7S1A704_NOCSC|mmetsp:Transcript_34016/g.90626  ORF Transcript_34016/g.90626 Transcript_34016/m.90626 type:complete len:476 (+) Transcript_34016:79-1506(+)
MFPRVPSYSFQEGEQETNPCKMKVFEVMEQTPTMSLEGLLNEALPDKSEHVSLWLQTLSDPSVCVTTIEDVERLDEEDIACLPVPPLVKGVFRAVLAKRATISRRERAVLEATKVRTKKFLAPLRDRNNQPPLAGSKYFQDLKHYRLILTREEIETGVRIAAHRIETWSKGERIVIVAILKGAFMFLSDLCRALTRPYSVFFAQASSYGNERSQSKTLAISSDVESRKFCDASTKKPHKIVIIDELLDNGKTMHDVKTHFLSCLSETHTERDILTACLFEKERARDLPSSDITPIKKLPDLWLVGYGLDDRGTKRGWVDLFAMPKVKIAETIDKDDVDRLISLLDEDATLTCHHVFGGIELPYSSQKQRFRVMGIDLDHGLSTKSNPQHMDFNRVASKADVVSTISPLPIVNGKFEKDIQIAFLQTNTHLTPEDTIFYGNNKLYGQMRCRLRDQIARDAKRFGLQSFEEVPETTA